MTLVSDQPILLTPQGPPRTVIPAEAAEVRHAVQQTLAAPAHEQRAAAAAIVATHPRSLIAWCTLGDVATDTVERYADCSEANNRYGFGAAHPMRSDTVWTWRDRCP